MCDVEIVLIVAPLLLAATGFCIYQVNSDEKVRHHGEIKSESPCEKGYKKFCLNGCESYYLDDKDFVACNCTWLYRGKRYQKYMWWT